MWLRTYEEARPWARSMKRATACAKGRVDAAWYIEKPSASSIQERHVADR